MILTEQIRRFLRRLQIRDPGILAPVEWLVKPRDSRSSSVPMVVIAGPPRSGTTLLYQTLVHSLQVNCITNLHHFLYRQPYLAHFIGESCLKPYVSDFRSHHGFIEGLNAPAEANQFWKYWFDQHLDARKPRPKSSRLDYALSWFRWVYQRTGRPFVAGWIGHVFYLEEMARMFPEALFLCVHRDLLSVAYSLWRVRISNGAVRFWWSLRPPGYQAVESLAPHYQVAWQAQALDDLVRRGQQTAGLRTISVDYNTFCDGPKGTLELVRAALRERGSQLEWRQDEDIPKRFDAVVHCRGKNQEVQRIADALEHLRHH